MVALVPASCPEAFGQVIMLDRPDISAMVNLFVSASQDTSTRHTVYGLSSIDTGSGST
jgi:hypothetical protein